MFTSRAEYRILLRQDDADMRLTPLAHAIGLADDHRYEITETKRRHRDDLIDFCKRTTVTAAEIDPLLERVGSSKLPSPCRCTVWCCARSSICSCSPRRCHGSPRKWNQYPPTCVPKTVEAAEVLMKYQGYIEREQMIADKLRRLEDVRIPDNYDFLSVAGLSTEARQKLDRIRPVTIGQASRIPGISPSDVNILLVLIRN